MGCIYIECSPVVPDRFYTYVRPDEGSRRGQHLLRRAAIVGGRPEIISPPVGELFHRRDAYPSRMCTY